MRLKLRQSLKLHTTPVNVFFYILEGRENIVIGNEKQEVTRNMLIESLKGIPHLFENIGVDFFTFLVISFLRPNDLFLFNDFFLYLYSFSSFYVTAYLLFLIL